MISPRAVLDYVKGKPFRPFRIHMASGRTFAIRHPELIKVTRSVVRRFNDACDGIPEESKSVSLTLIESISHSGAPAPC